MPTPPKPAKLIAIEGKSHRTKKELREREKAEAALLTGKTLKETEEVKNNKIAHKEFLRIRKLLQRIEKNDDLYGSTINRYCLLLAECTEFEEKRETIFSRQKELEERKDDMEFSEYINLQNDLVKSMLALDKQVQSKRKMLLDIEKENVMTIAASLRSIPKKTEKKNPLREALSG
jgi:hypothetical protein